VQSVSLDQLDGVKKEGQSFGLHVLVLHIEDEIYEFGEYSVLIPKVADSLKEILSSYGLSVQHPGRSLFIMLQTAL